MWVVMIYISLLPFVFGCFLIQKSWPRWCKLVLVDCGISTLADWGTTYYSHVTHTSNHWIFNLYIPLECAFIIVIFHSASDPRSVRLFNRWLLAMIPVLVTIAYIILPEFYVLNSIASTGCSMLILLSACSAFIGTLVEKEGDLPFFSQPLFWWATGQIIYSLNDSIYYVTLVLTRKMILFQYIMLMNMTAGALLSICIAACFISARSPKAVSDTRHQ